MKKFRKTKVEKIAAFYEAYEPSIFGAIVTVASLALYLILTK